MKTQEIKLDYLARMHELFYGESLEDRIKKIKTKAKIEKQKAVAEKEISIQSLLRTGLLTEEQISETMNVTLRKVRALKKKMNE